MMGRPGSDCNCSVVLDACAEPNRLRHARVEEGHAPGGRVFEAACLKGLVADRSLVRARQRRIVAPTVFVLMPHNGEQTPLLLQQLLIAALHLQVKCTSMFTLGTLALSAWILRSRMPRRYNTTRPYFCLLAHNPPASPTAKAERQRKTFQTASKREKNLTAAEDRHVLRSPPRHDQDPSGDHVKLTPADMLQVVLN